MKHCEHRADQLKKEGHKILDHTEKDFKKADKAQAKAQKEAVKANIKTEKALNREIEGQEKLVMAGKPTFSAFPLSVNFTSQCEQLTLGQKLIEAGAKLQAEAAISGSGHEVKYNVHDTAKVKQQTSTMTGALAAKGIDTAQEEFVVRQTKPGYCR